ncbi:alpha/beta hydrolase [Roseovarius sp. CAU 1744]|uniref:alpha/beta fold hydrolase n=1 Tax=Roseovarius sp. CAU 1744 TaxID=3140368 RepID=UPI00325BCE6B
MPNASKAGFDTYWTSYGQGPRAGLMIHCSLASCAAWGGLARHLSGALTMTAFDMPGHGRSADWDARGEIQGVTTRIAGDFLDAPTDVIGHSFGATVALRLAAEQPEMVRTLTLIEPVFFAVAFADQPELAREHTGLMAGYEAAMTAGEHLEAAREFTGIWGEGAPFSTLTKAKQQELATRMPVVAAGNAALHQDPGGLLQPDRLARVAMPVLIVNGTESPPIVGAICEGLERRLPDARRAIVAGAGHMAPLTHAGPVGAEILQFLRRH